MTNSVTAARAMLLNTRDFAALMARNDLKCDSEDLILDLIIQYLDWQRSRDVEVTADDEKCIMSQIRFN